MKICFVAHASNLTGANNSMINLMEVLLKSDVQFHVIIPENGLIEDKLKEMNIPYDVVKTYSRMHKIGTKRNLLKDVIKIIINYISKIKIKGILKREKIDIVHINSLMHYVTARAAKECNIPYIWHFREFLDEDHGLEIDNKKEMKELINKADSKIAISRSIYDKFEKIYSQKNLELVYNGIPTKQYDQYEFIPVEFKEDINLCLIGRIAKGKGQLVAIKAIQNIIKKNTNKKFILYIIGNPADEIEYDKKIKEYVTENDLQENVKFVSFTTNLSEYRKKCRICLVCSKKEAFGRVTIEAMLANQLVIASNTGGNLELIEDKKTGLLYEETDYNDLSKKIEYVLNNEQEVNEIITNAKLKAKEKFSIENTAK